MVGGRVEDLHVVNSGTATFDDDGEVGGGAPASCI
jgi:hypothetical protein